MRDQDKPAQDSGETEITSPRRPLGPRMRETLQTLERCERMHWRYLATATKNRLRALIDRGLADCDLVQGQRVVRLSDAGRAELVKPRPNE